VIPTKLVFDPGNRRWSQILWWTSYSQSWW